MKHLGIFVILGILAAVGIFSMSLGVHAQNNTVEVLATESDIQTTIEHNHVPFNQNIGSSTETRVFFPGIFNHFRVQTSAHQNAVPGIFIYRPTRTINANDVFFGNVHVDRVNLPFTDFEFTPLRHVNGEWIPTTWFSLDEHVDGMGVEFTFRKNLPAGRYAIMAQAFERYLDNGGNFSRRPAMIQDWGYGEMFEVPAISIYEIFYAEDLRYITSRDNLGNNIFNARTQSSQTITVEVSANAGAMDKGLLPTRTVDGFQMGNMYLDARINLSNMEITVERQGVTMSNDLISVWGWESTLTIQIPATLPEGHFVVRMVHPTNEYVFGTFVIDNSAGIGLPSDLSGMVTAFFILGTILAVAAVALFATPKFMLAMQERKYAAMQNQRYMTDGEGAIDDRAYKAQSAKGSLEGAKERASQSLKETKSKGFLDAMKENRAKREMAREHGLTMEEYREIEAKLKKTEDDKVTGLQSFRQAMEEHTGRRITIEKEVEPSKRPLMEGDQVEILDSVARDAMVADEMIGKQAIQPNVAPGSGTIMSNLRNMAGEAEQSQSTSTVAPNMQSFQNVPPVQQSPNPNLQPIVDTPLVEAPQQTPPTPVQQTQPEPNQQDTEKSTPPPSSGGSILSRLGKIGGDN